MTKEQEKKLQEFQLTSDLFFSVVLEDISACQEVVGILLRKNFVIKGVKTQYSIRQLLQHSIVLDALAEEISGTKVNVEMHPQSGEARVKRMRYNLSSIDVDSLEKNTDYNNIPDTIGIYITKADFLETKKGINHVIRMVEGTNQKIPNGVEEYYVCLSQEGDTVEQTMLMQYILNSDGITESKIFPNLVRRVRFLKNEPKGMDIMCEIMDQLIAEAVEKLESKILEAETKLMETAERAIEAEEKAIEAEEKAIEAEEKAIEAEEKAIEAEEKAIEAEEKAIEAEEKAIKVAARGIAEALSELDVHPEKIISKLMEKLSLTEETARTYLI